MAALIKNGFDVSLAFVELDDGKLPRPPAYDRTPVPVPRAGGSDARNVTAPVPAAQTLVPAAPAPDGADAGGSNARTGAAQTLVPEAPTPDGADAGGSNARTGGGAGQWPPVASGGARTGSAARTGGGARTDGAARAGGGARTGSASDGGALRSQAGSVMPPVPESPPDSPAPFVPKPWGRGGFSQARHWCRRLQRRPARAPAAPKPHRLQRPYRPTPTPAAMAPVCRRWRPYRRCRPYRRWRPYRRRRPYRR